MFSLALCMESQHLNPHIVFENPSGAVRRSNGSRKVGLSQGDPSQILHLV